MAELWQQHGKAVKDSMQVKKAALTTALEFQQAMDHQHPYLQIPGDDEGYLCDQLSALIARREAPHMRVDPNTLVAVNQLEHYTQTIHGP